ncbi:uncharacterized WD repeat-containing protein C2A9.03-like [Benincasa hispida]|uniref:uncharacterized WD repeat-containing protein C2A9.03-like n=1 Tax=Benincasa hispida TaxID=102211 RepID=UPI001901E161|nr:uncharacterized WD repeat-containing protein C2A9.03-like [Benincasa hispida]
MASLVLLLSELLRHHNTNPDYWLTIPLPPPPSPPRTSSSVAGKSLLPSERCYSNKSRICADETVIDEFLKESRAIGTVVGHRDYSSASAWHSDGRMFATGNQDKTCRVWDVRNFSTPVAVLKGHISVARSIRYSSDGQFMVVAEPVDFVHVYSTSVYYKKRQEIDFFGEISRVSLSPDDESLYIGIWDRTYASLLQYNRRHTYGYIDSFL